MKYFIVYYMGDTEDWMDSVFVKKYDAERYIKGHPSRKALRIVEESYDKLLDWIHAEALT